MRSRLIGLGALIGVGAIVAGVLAAQARRERVADRPEPPGGAAAPKRHSVVIRKPAGPPSVRTGLTDRHGQPITVACQVCHTTRPANADTRASADLDEFHQGLKVKHGELACVSCHNPADGYASLRLADGRALPFSEVM